MKKILYLLSFESSLKRYDLFKIRHEIKRIFRENQWVHCFLEFWTLSWA